MLPRRQQRTLKECVNVAGTRPAKQLPSTQARKGGGSFLEAITKKSSSSASRAVEVARALQPEREHAPATLAKNPFAVQAVSGAAAAATGRKLAGGQPAERRRSQGLKLPTRRARVAKPRKPAPRRRQAASTSFSLLSGARATPSNPRVLRGQRSARYNHYGECVPHMDASQVLGDSGGAAFGLGEWYGHASEPATIANAAGAGDELKYEYAGMTTL